MYGIWGQGRELVPSGRVISLFVILGLVIISVPIINRLPVSSEIELGTKSKEQLAAATLHTIIVAHTNETASGVDKDVDRIKNLVDDIGQKTCLRLSTTVIDGNTIASGGGYDKVKSAIENLSVNSNDVVLFYYSGLGLRSRDSDSLWPDLVVEGETTTSNRWIKLTWVISALKAKNSRFFMVIVDASNAVLIGRVRDYKGAQPSVYEQLCLNDIGYTVASSYIPGGYSLNVFLSGRGHGPGGTLPSVSAYEQLFLNYTGYIVISSSKPGQNSLGNLLNGGFFTQQFLKSLSDGMKFSNPDWAHVIAQATQVIRVNHSGQKVQQPQAEVQVFEAKGRRIACAASPGSTVVVSPKGTCADNVYYTDKEGKRCCVNKAGEELCLSD